MVGAIRGLPLLAFGLVAGVVADRYGRKAQLIIAQVVNALLNVALATLVLTGYVHPWHVYVTGFLAGTVQAFQQPARQALINDLVGPGHLLNAVALNSAALNLSRSVGPALALIQASGVDLCYYVQASFYVFATLWTVQMTVPPQSQPRALTNNRANQSFFASTKEGISYVISNRLILALMVLGLAPIVLGMPFVSLMPIFAIDVFHGGARAQGLLLTSVGIGALLGALGMASLGRNQGNGRFLIGGAVAFGLSLIPFSHSPDVAMATAFALLAGFFNVSYTSQDQTIIQMLVPGELRGRVLGIYLLNRGLMPLGSLLAGVLAHFLGGPSAVTVMGISCVVLAAAVGLLVPSLRRLNLTGPTIAGHEG